jgi:hypothetical protein
MDMADNEELVITDVTSSGFSGYNSMEYLQTTAVTGSSGVPSMLLPEVENTVIAGPHPVELVVAVCGLILMVTLLRRYSQK